jgi:hypothetical protein
LLLLQQHQHHLLAGWIGDGHRAHAGQLEFAEAYSFFVIDTRFHLDSTAPFGSL